MQQSQKLEYLREKVVTLPPRNPATQPIAHAEEECENEYCSCHVVAGQKEREAAERKP